MPVKMDHYFLTQIKILAVHKPVKNRDKAPFQTLFPCAVKQFLFLNIKLYILIGCTNFMILS